MDPKQPRDQLKSKIQRCRPFGPPPFSVSGSSGPLGLKGCTTTEPKKQKKNLSPKLTINMKMGNSNCFQQIQTHKLVFFNTIPLWSPLRFLSRSSHPGREKSVGNGSCPQPNLSPKVSIQASQTKSPPLCWRQLYMGDPTSHSLSKPLYQARESSLVPLRLLTVHFLQKTQICEAFVIVQC